jgi:uncharacterized membrane protein
MSDKDKDKAKQPVHLMAAVYADGERGKVILDMLEEMHKANTITLVDAARLTKTEDGKFKVEETAELTARKGGRRGAIIAGVFGLIYPPSLILSVAAGGGIGALAGILRDTGIKKDDMKQFADEIQPGQAAVIALAEAQYAHLIENALEGYDGHLLTQEIAGDTAEDINAAAAAANLEDE